jgi:hypothetical protein
MGVPAITATSLSKTQFDGNRLLIMSSERNVDYAPQSSFMTVISILDPETFRQEIAYTSDDVWWNISRIAGSEIFGKQILIAKKRINDEWRNGGTLDFLDISLKAVGRNPLKIAGIYYYQAFFLSGGNDFVYLAYDGETKKNAIYYSFEVDNLTVNESSLITETSGISIPSNTFNGYYYFNVNKKVFREAKRISQSTENVSYILPTEGKDKVYYVESNQVKWISLVDGKSGVLVDDPSHGSPYTGFRGTFMSLSPDATKLAYRLPSEKFEILHITTVGGKDIATKKVLGSLFWFPGGKSLLIASKPIMLWNVEQDITTIVNVPEWDKFGVGIGDIASSWGFPTESPLSPDGKYLLLEYPYDYSKNADIINLSTMEIYPVVVENLMVNTTGEFRVEQIEWAGGK